MSTEQLTAETFFCRHSIYRLFALIFLVSSISACQTVGEDGQVVYNAFFTPADHVLKTLEADGDGGADIQEAYSIYLSERPYFQDAKNKDALPVMQMLATALMEDMGPELSQHMEALGQVEWPQATTQWSRTADIINQSFEISRKIPVETLFKDSGMDFPEVTAFMDMLLALRKDIENDTVSEFADYDLMQPPFHETYPVGMEDPHIISSELVKRKGDFDALTIDQFATVLEKYPSPKFVKSEDQGTLVGWLKDRVSSEMVSEYGKGIEADIRTVKFLENANIEIPGGEVPAVGFASATSKSLMTSGTFDYPGELEIDVPIEVINDNLGTILLGEESPDTILVFQVALAKASRRIENMRSKQSRFIAGYTSDPNPDYQQAQIDMNHAQMQLSSAQSQVAVSSMYTGLGGLVMQLAAHSEKKEAQEKYEEALAIFQEMPQFVQNPVYQNYTYREGTVKARKTMTVNYMIIDKTKKNYYDSTLDIVEKEQFNLGYGLHPEDPELSTISNTLDSEDQVVEWEKNGSTISLSLLLDHYLENKKSRKEYKNADQLLAKLNDEKNRIIAKYDSENFEEKSLKDPRFDHTVAIFTGESLGSGFYVTPDVVMTNYHVVDEAQFVELKKYDGTETFGRVIAKDARLDLALVSVQSRGVPVRFMTAKDLHPGDYIDVIGHPQGYEFTITRGIVSAIRRHSSIVASGGDDVLFVQTDADINPGNSGGPVFKGDLVIGVSDWGRSDSTGLNFLIHFSEVLNFLKGNLPGWKTS